MSATLAEYKVEEALQDLLQAQADIAALITADTDSGKESPFDVYTGIDDGAVDYSCILVQATSSEPIIGMGPMIGNWTVNVSVKVITNFKEPDKGKAEHYQRIGYVQAVIMDDALQTSLGAVCIGEPMMRGRTLTTANDCWIHETQIAVPCMDGA